MKFQLTSGLQPELLENDQKQWLANAICGAITAAGKWQVLQPQQPS